MIRNVKKRELVKKLHQAGYVKFSELKQVKSTKVIEKTVKNNEEEEEPKEEE